MSMQQRTTYTKADIQLGSIATVSREDGVTAHSHVVEFIALDRARYTLRQTSMQGAWKDLLFAILTNFSREIAPIARHDESRAFAPEAVIIETD